MSTYDADGRPVGSRYRASLAGGIWPRFGHDLRSTRVGNSAVPGSAPSATYGTQVGPEQGGFTYEPMVTRDRIVFTQYGPDGNNREVFSILDRDGNIVASVNVADELNVSGVNMEQVASSPSGQWFVSAEESYGPAPVGWDKDGNNIWRTVLPNGGDFADTTCPMIYGGNVYIATYEFSAQTVTHLFKLDVTDGTILDSLTYWDTDAFLFYTQSHPVYEDEGILLAPYDTGLARIDLDTFSVTGRFETSVGDWLQWAPGDDGLVFSGEGDDYVVAYDVAADAEAYRINVANQFNLPYGPVVQLQYDPATGYRVGYAGYLASGVQNIQELIAVDPADGSTVWQRSGSFDNNASTSYFVRVADGGRMVMGPDNSDTIWCWDTEDGSLLWSFNIPDLNTSQAIPVDGRLLYIDWGPNAEVRPVWLA